MEEALAGSLRLEKYPKSRFDCFVLVLEDDGGALPAAITAASLALADAGVEMYDMVTACSAALIEQNGTSAVVLDPTWDEEFHATGLLTLAFSPSLSAVTHLLQTGHFSAPQMAEVSTLPSP